jgi:hypothetical protein
MIFFSISEAKNEEAHELLLTRKREEAHLKNNQGKG